MRCFQIGLLISMSLLSSIGVAQPSPDDPWESMNRKIWKFNETVDRYVLSPITKGYQKITPNVVERGVSRFFANLDNIPSAANNLLQGKPGKAGQNIARFVFNATFGGLGVYDFASDIGLPISDEDLGQTLGVWGVPNGPYMVIPFIGPSTVRDTGGWAVELLIYDPLEDAINDSTVRTELLTLSIIDIRAQLGNFYSLAPSEPYSFFRDAYLQRRASQVRDGKAKEGATDDFLSDDF